jgi:hypothetical protein
MVWRERLARSRARGHAPRVLPATAAQRLIDAPDLPQRKASALRSVARGVRSDRGLYTDNFSSPTIHSMKTFVRDGSSRALG